MNYLAKVRSKYILKQIFDNLKPKLLLSLINYNKNFQKKLEIKIEDFKKLSFITEIELILAEKIYGNFVKIRKGNDSHFKIYFDNSKEPIKRQKIYKKDKVKKIKIVINNQYNSYYGLFRNCICIEKLTFKKFNKNDIIGMSYMFHGCFSLKN